MSSSLFKFPSLTPKSQEMSSDSAALRLGKLQELLTANQISVTSLGEHRSAIDNYNFLLNKHGEFIAHKFTAEAINEQIFKLFWEHDGPEAEEHYGQCVELLKPYVPHFVYLNKQAAGQAVLTAFDLKMPGLAYALLLEGADQEAETKDETNLLMKSALCGDVNCMALLLNTQKIAIDKVDSFKKSALDYARHFASEHPEQGKACVAMLEEAQKAMANKSVAQPFSM